MITTNLESFRTISIREAVDKLYIRADDSTCLSYEESGELFEYIERNQLDKENFKWQRDRGGNLLKIVNYVGYIRLSSVAIEILPKISIEDNVKSRKVLLDMLYYSGYCEVKFSEISDVEDIHFNLFEIMGYEFAMNLKQVLLKGANATYISTESNISVLRGKLLVNKHITNIARCTAKVYCQYDEFSMNNVLNAILKRVVKLLLHKVSNTKTLNLLKFCLLHYEEVDDSTVSKSDLAMVKFDRTNSRFAVVFSLAKLLWLERSTLNCVGDSNNFSLLFKMNKLFESYISALVMQCTNYNVSLQDEIYHLVADEQGEKCFSIRPDIVIGRENNKQLIIDTKWKNVKKEKGKYRIERNDYLQMYTYLTRYDSAITGILLYPYKDDYGFTQPMLSYFLEGHFCNEKKLSVYTVDYENVDKTKQQLEKILSTIM